MEANEYEALLRLSHDCASQLLEDAFLFYSCFWRNRDAFSNHSAQRA